MWNRKKKWRHTSGYGSTCSRWYAVSGPVSQTFRRRSHWNSTYLLFINQSSVMRISEAKSSIAVRAEHVFRDFLNRNFKSNNEPECLITSLWRHSPVTMTSLWRSPQLTWRYHGCFTIIVTSLCRYSTVTMTSLCWYSTVSVTSLWRCQ